MSNRQLLMDNDEFADGVTRWLNSLNAIWLREHMLDDLIRRRGNNPQSLPFPFEYYMQVPKGSLHEMDSTGLHYNKRKLQPYSGWKTVDVVLKIDRNIHWPGIDWQITPGASARTWEEDAQAIIFARTPSPDAKMLWPQFGPFMRHVPLSLACYLPPASQRHNDIMRMRLCWMGGTEDSILIMIWYAKTCGDDNISPRHTTLVINLSSCLTWKLPPSKLMSHNRKEAEVPLPVRMLKKSIVHMQKICQ